MSAISIFEIEEKKEALKQSIENLNNSIQIFNETTKEIQELINVLHSIYNTTGGNQKIKEISNIEFDCEGLNKIGLLMETISCKAQTETITIVTKPQ